ncbi:hypothetical protein TCDM_09259 [Trypanosoma cruzi Dm28c]|uniref:Uncharacterized protein n=1 Tax=Trypanosoma cruzi Dm28c TaxID=1416333 RepID=V5BEW8_TRYCR|nr:hypothetical protein TCDM_09259 [Trypanosoma cruzi Dm28c]
MGAAEPERRMVLARCETWAIDDGGLQSCTRNMMGQASGHTRRAVVSTQLVPAATGARTARCGAPRGPRHRHAHCRPGGSHCSQRASSPRAFLHSTVQVPVCVLQDLERGGAQGSTSAQQEAQLDGSGKCGTAPTSTITHGGSTHPSTKQKKNTAAGCGCVCGAAGVCQPWPQRKQKGKKCVLRPTGPRRTPTRHGSLSAPFVAAPPHACSRRGAQGRRRERVGGCAGGAVGRKHTAPLAGRVQQQTIKEGRVEKKKVHSDCPKSKERREGSKKLKQQNRNMKKRKHEKNAKKSLKLRT